MSKLYRTIAGFFKTNIPLLVVIGIALVVAVTNIDVDKHYAGWDNILAEFNLNQYAKQVIFGAWSEHQGLGAPSAQGQLAEVPRLPILYLLTFLLPINLVRYFYIFGLYLIGGVSLYFYLRNYWLEKANGWLASLGASLYLLHPLTLQQFYISFEMFMAQFAFLPLLLIALHHLSQKIDFKNILFFSLVQLLIAPSAHTPTVFYLGALFSISYFFFLNLSKGFKKAIILSFLLGVFTFFLNSYWILPNLYYSFFHSDYVSQSRDNVLFAPESIWSVRESGTVNNLLKGTHYLFEWKDYNIETKQFEFIFAEWREYFSQPIVDLGLKIIGLLVIFGTIPLALIKRKKSVSWAILLWYVFCLSFIFIDLFPTKFIFNKLYQIPSFVEAFRNNFTKLSIIYSVVVVILFVTSLEFLWESLLKKIKNIYVKSIVGSIFLGLAFLVLMYVSAPAFKGHFINEKLEVKFPAQYFEMFAYLKKKDERLRVLQLPQLNHAGWEYYDWQFIEAGNGYQGMGFYFFGMPQAFLNRDSDRWVESSDTFYYQLKNVLDKKDEDHLSRLLEKYQVDVVIIDESKFDPNRKHSFVSDHQLLTEAGLDLGWHKDFLYVYERQEREINYGLFAVEDLHLVNTEEVRVKQDVAFMEGSYVNVNQERARQIFPFTDLNTDHPDLQIKNGGVELHSQLGFKNYTIKIPEYKDDNYLVSAQIDYIDGQVSVKFPQYTMETDLGSEVLAQVPNFSFEVPESEAEQIILFFDDFGVILRSGETAYPVLDLKTGNQINVSWSSKPESLSFDQSGKLSPDLISLRKELVLEPDWQQIQAEKVMTGGGDLKVRSNLDPYSIDLGQNPSINCSKPHRGEISTINDEQKYYYLVNDFAVNCNGYSFPYFSSSASYLMEISGGQENQVGRGLKFFINYLSHDILPEDYLFKDEKYKQIITINKVTDDPRLKFHLNWEARSFGKESVSFLEEIRIVPFDLDKFSRLVITTDQESAEWDHLEIEQVTQLTPAILITDITCEGSKCVIGFDQTYDNLWMLFKLDSMGVKSHFKLNGWSNGWFVYESGKYLLLYVPELISLVLLGTVLLSIVVICILYFISAQCKK